MGNYRNKKVLEEARNHPCQFCGADDGTVVAAHSNQVRHGKGMGIKAHDLPAYLCSQCHFQVDQGFMPKAWRISVWMRGFLNSLPLYEHMLDARGLALATQMRQGK